MTKRMLIDATHAEETRVVVLDGSRLEDFDVETASKRQLKGNIYLAKVVRVEPSLQAAFVEYGGGRHGFLAFGEIHPDYYQIPVADRQRLLAMQAEEARAAEAEEDEAAEAGEVGAADRQAANSGPEDVGPDDPGPDDPGADRARGGGPAEGVAEPAMEMPHGGSAIAEDPAGAEAGAEPGRAPDETPGGASDGPPDATAETGGGGAMPASILRDEVFGSADYVAPPVERAEDADPAPPPNTTPEPDAPTPFDAEPVTQGGEDPPGDPAEATAVGASLDPFDPPATPGPAADMGSEPEFPGRFDVVESEAPPPETVGGAADPVDETAAEEARTRRANRMLRSYRIQEVIHRRQIMLVQVVKEERGTKGAALTTYISLAGRFSVLMPNSPRGGGISRKITSAADRKRLREVTQELNLPDGMGLIVRTAGANRPKPEIKRDCEYLMRLWDDIREHTFRSIAPALIYEEASLIKRAIRDVYSRDIDDIVVDGEEGWRAAHDFMRMLMPSHARKVQLWRPGADGQPGQSLFARHQVEAQLDAMVSPTVPLKSGGYLVINQTEALVAIDVNSGRSTRERNIEETALRTNLEAADEAARQLRLRDLAGLIVIDFIDMESRRNNAAVERRLKDALRVDRARIQVGSISHFGLLEMSRQRLRPSLTETTFETCPHCGGTGHVRTIDGSAIQVLRAIEEEGGKNRASVIMVHAAGAVVMYLLNNKRDRLAAIEQRYDMRVQFAIDAELHPGHSRIEKVRGREDAPPRPAASTPVVPAAPVDLVDQYDDADFEDIDEADAPDAVAPAYGAPVAAARLGGATAAPDGAALTAAEDGERRRRRRRRRRGGRRDETGQDAGTDADGAELPEAAAAAADAPPAALLADEQPDDTSATPGQSATPHAMAAHPDISPEPVEALAEPLEAADGQPTIDPADLDEDGLPKARRRGRRGGRRRRREEEEGAPAAETAPQETAPRPVAYVGPTPADPFGGGGFDIFDVIDTAADFASARPHSVPVPPAPFEPLPEQPSPEPRPSLEPALPDVPAMAAGPASSAATPEPDHADQDQPAPTALIDASPDIPVDIPVAIPVDSQPEAPPALPPALPAGLPPEPEAQDRAPSPSEPVIGPPIQPVLIGGDSVGAERKRGWWRRGA